MVNVKPPRGDLYSVAVTIREGGRVILQYSDAISPVMLVKNILEPVTSPRGPWAARKGAGALLNALGEDDIIYLG